METVSVSLPVDIVNKPNYTVIDNSISNTEEGAYYVIKFTHQHLEKTP